MEEKGTFPIGILNAKGTLCRDFILAERTFRHTLELSNDQSLDRERLGERSYYDAAILSKRLSVAGVDRLTPDQVLDLSGEDGDALMDAIVALEQRREEFRKAPPGEPKKTGGSPQARD